MKPQTFTIGILGGGQLGKMLCIAASKLGMKCHIFDPDIDCPAKSCCRYFTNAKFTDKNKLKAFAKDCSIITYEFENIPIDTVNYLEKFCQVFPKANALSVCQNREKEKKFFKKLGLNTAPYFLVNKKTFDKFHKIKFDSQYILKTTKDGYDGKGQEKVSNFHQLKLAFTNLNHVDCILEEKIDFDTELSVIISRNKLGNVVCYEPGENEHLNGILKKTIVPSNISSFVKHQAILISGKLINSLDYVGVMGIEFFLKNEILYVNEMAPRVHNTGHWTQDTCMVDQFEQHIRSISDLPLGDGKRYADVEMINLLGDEINKISKYKDCSIHIYGKKEVKPNRKMGHVNIIKKGVI